VIGLVTLYAWKVGGVRYSLFHSLLSSRPRQPVQLQPCYWHVVLEHETQLTQIVRIPSQQLSFLSRLEEAVLRLGQFVRRLFKLAVSL
jgi:hypothetical protein